MIYNFPTYEKLNWPQIMKYRGSKLFKLIDDVCEDVVIIDPDSWQNYSQYDWLEFSISQYLAQGKKIFLIPNEEALIWPANDHLRQIFDHYQDKDVWLVTQLRGNSKKIYSFNHNYRVKLLEIPYILFELCELYYHSSKRQKPNLSVIEPGPHFLCTTRRLNQHKQDLIEIIYEQGLSHYGMMLIDPDLNYPRWIEKICVRNRFVPSPEISGSHRVERLTQHNIENFFAFESAYQNVPLIIHAETSCGQFYSTEKSLWPLLLGKMTLTFGPPENTQNIQHFYDFDFGRYAQLDFDRGIEDWSSESHQKRILTMLEQNVNLIRNSKDFYAQHHKDLEAARWTMGKNFYQFIVQQIQNTKEG